MNPPIFNYRVLFCLYQRLKSPENIPSVTLGYRTPQRIHHETYFIVFLSFSFTVGVFYVRNIHYSTLLRGAHIIRRARRFSPLYCSKRFHDRANGIFLGLYISFSRCPCRPLPHEPSVLLKQEQQQPWQSNELDDWLKWCFCPSSVQLLCPSCARCFRQEILHK